MMSFRKLSKLFLQYQVQSLRKQTVKFGLFRNLVISNYRSVASTSSVKPNEENSIKLPDFNENVNPENTEDWNSAPPISSVHSDELESVNFSPEDEKDAFRSIDQDLRKHDSEVSHFIDDLAPPLRTSFNLAAFANRSTAIQKFVELNVDLAKIEKKPEYAKFVAQLDFETDVKPYIQFLHDHGVPPDKLAVVITKNPLLFKHSLENLQIRINYFQSKRFDADAIARIIVKCPIMLSMDTRSVDKQLGHFQKTFNLSGDEIRFLFTKYPQLISHNRKEFNEILFSIKEEMGFNDYEMKKLLLMKPKIWTLDRIALRKRFDIVHNLMGISHKQILTFPGILLKRGYQLEQRHQYLKKIGRAQYDPSKPSYIPLERIATTTDYKFCTDCAKTSVAAYNEFLKTL